MSFSMDKMVIRNQQGHSKPKVSVAFGLYCYMNVVQQWKTMGYQHLNFE